MNDRIVEDARGDLRLSTDRSELDVDTILAMLLASHWGAAMTKAILERAIENSVCFGIYDASGRQLAFARVVSDLATYAYLTDVIVAADARGRGCGSWMIEAMLAHPDLQSLRRIALWTRDARSLYERYGFSTEMPASTYMELRTRPPYATGA
ncbi:MAG TPA: GNAT family N-acetyltransferase [Gemmatimonadaceae bacterium]|jgi:GNAT superfamily N-acetyltransferase|nr:GNAT family N-acetyltransferase [Gemmatimonadaceae bacterium]